MTSIRYQVGGALLQDVSSYVTRDSDRQLLEALKAGEFCYVLNSRQMGKSSLMVRTLAQLQEAGWKGIVLARIPQVNSRNGIIHLYYMD